MTRLRILQERTSFLGYDEPCRETLKELRPLLAPALDGILDDFYRFMRERPETRELLPTAEVALRASRAQKEHWLQMLSGEALGDAHCARAVQIGHTHERIGLGLSAYLGGYCIVLNRFAELIAERHRDQPGAVAEKIQAIQKAVFLDIDFVIESYLEAKNSSIRKILLSAEQFIGEVEQLEGGLAAAGGELGPEAEKLAAGLADCRERLAALQQDAPPRGRRHVERVLADLAACEQGAKAVALKWRAFSRKLERLTEEVAARRERHRLSFAPPGPPGLLPRLKKAAQTFFPARP